MPVKAYDRITRIIIAIKRHHFIILPPIIIKLQQNGFELFTAQEVFYKCLNTIENFRLNQCNKDKPHVSQQTA